MLSVARVIRIFPPVGLVRSSMKRLRILSCVRVSGNAVPPLNKGFTS
jgi:hypothetical protein